VFRVNFVKAHRDFNNLNGQQIQFASNLIAAHGKNNLHHQVFSIQITLFHYYCNYCFFKYARVPLKATSHSSREAFSSSKTRQKLTIINRGFLTAPA
jgi:hypothetical protein